MGPADQKSNNPKLSVDPATNSPPTCDAVSQSRSSIDQSSRRNRLIAIPATLNNLGSPFMRAYPSDLASVGISVEVFLSFLDDLNCVAVASPPVQVLGLVGTAVSFVPLHTAQIVGGVVNAAATVTTYAMSKGRTEMLLRAANRDLFGPCGLHAQIARLDTVAKLSGMPILTEKGKVDKTSPLLLPIYEDNGHEMASVGSQQRRLQALSPWIAPLEITSLPDLERPTNFISNMHASVSERQRIKEEKKIIKERNKRQTDFSKASKKTVREYEKELGKIIRRQEKARAKGDTKEVAQLNKERAKETREYKKEMHKIYKERLKDDEEEKSLRKIFFLIIQNAIA